MSARMFREYEIRRVVDRDLAEVPQATFVGEVKSSQAMYDELANASGEHEMWVIPVTSIGLIDSQLAAARRVTA